MAERDNALALSKYLESIGINKDSMFLQEDRNTGLSSLGLIDSRENGDYYITVIFSDNSLILQASRKTKVDDRQALLEYFNSLNSFYADSSFFISDKNEIVAKLVLRNYSSDDIQLASSSLIEVCDLAEEAWLSVNAG